MVYNVSWKYTESTSEDKCENISQKKELWDGEHYFGSSCELIGSEFKKIKFHLRLIQREKIIFDSIKFNELK
jgi:hypothetical protein